MKKILAVFSLCLFLFAGCSAQAQPKDEASSSQPPVIEKQETSSPGSAPANKALDEYLSHNSEYIEPTCVEWENKQMEIENHTLYKINGNGEREMVLDKVSDSAWAPFAEHAILVVQEGCSFIKVDTQKWTTETLYESERPVTAINTNGTLVFFSTDTQIYRYFIPTNTVDLIATDEMLKFISSPFTTTDIWWVSYNPLWLKKYYELGGDENIYNTEDQHYFFCDTRTGKIYNWKPERREQSVEEGFEWYKRQRGSST